MNGGSSSCSTLLFTDKFDGPGKNWSCVMRCLDVLSPFSFIVPCSGQPSGAMDMFFMYLCSWNGRTRAKALETSSVNSSDRISGLSVADLQFPLEMWNSLSKCLISLSKGSSGKVAPYSSVSFVYFQSGCCDRIVSRSEVSSYFRGE